MGEVGAGLRRLAAPRTSQIRTLCAPATKKAASRAAYLTDSKMDLTGIEPVTS